LPGCNRATGSREDAMKIGSKDKTTAAGKKHLHFDKGTKAYDMHVKFGSSLLGDLFEDMGEKLAEETLTGALSRAEESGEADLCFVTKHADRGWEGVPSALADDLDELAMFRAEAEAAAEAAKAADESAP